MWHTSRMTRKIHGKECYVNYCLDIKVKGEHGEEDPEAEEDGGDQGNGQLHEKTPLDASAAAATHLVDEEEDGEYEAGEEGEGGVGGVERHTQRRGEGNLHKLPLVE